MTDLYERLAQYLDDLPAGYPRTDSGIELQILKKLFTPEEAELLPHLTLLAEPPHVIAFRARKTIAQTRNLLDQMERKGLISGSHPEGEPPQYAASQFVVGFWEDQVNRLDREMAELFEEFAPHYYRQGYWSIQPQLRTIPVGESIPVTSEVMPYEQAEVIIRSNTLIAVRNCVCRQERELLDHGCGKPLETCLSFGGAARNTAATGKGRLITIDEALKILKKADRAGLVLQPANSKNPAFLCACCGCCCGVLRNIKRHTRPVDWISSAFTARLDRELCLDCGTCVNRCQMDAIIQGHDGIQFHPERCIGCGLCVSSCPVGAWSLSRKDFPRPIPQNTLHTYLQMGWSRKKFGRIVSMALRSGFARLMAAKDKP